ncbi:MAG: nuclear transport factor 2 family protein [Flavobacterium sp.]
MKAYFFAILLLLSAKCFCQSTSESEVLRTSHQIFAWEVESKIDSVSNKLSNQFLVSGSDGSLNQKKGYIERLKSGNFKHNSINVLEDRAVISGNTAIVMGIGDFDITISGNQKITRLSYIEVFVKDDNEKQWKMIALKASAVQ